MPDSSSNENSKKIKGEMNPQQAPKDNLKFNVCALIFNAIAVLLYIVVFGMGVSIENNDKTQNMTIYTQAATDWRKLSWASFRLSNDGCNIIEQVIDAKWLGTYPGEIIDDG